NVMDGVRPVADMMDRVNEISTTMGDPPEDADFDALMTEMGELQENIDAVDGWSLDNQLEIAIDALRCPPGDSPIENPSGGVEGHGKQKVFSEKLGWIRLFPKPRLTKSKARIKAVVELVEAAENRTSGKAQSLIQVTERLGGSVSEGSGLTKAGGDKLLFG